MRVARVFIFRRARIKGSLFYALYLMEQSAPKFRQYRPTTQRPARINYISPNEQYSTGDIADVISLILGSVLNLLVILVILLKSSMRTSSHYYIVSLCCTSFVILLQPLQSVLRSYFGVDMGIDVDYISLITFDVPIVTIAVLHVERYICVCQRDSRLCKIVLKSTTAIKGILLIWTIIVMFIAIELHLYDFFEVTMKEIFICSTFMFTLLPSIVFVIIDALILYEFAVLKAIEGTWRSEELRQFATMVTITASFLLLMVPHRMVQAIRLGMTKSPSCIETAREILYSIMIAHPIIFPIIFIVGSTSFRRALQEIVSCRHAEPRKRINADV